MRGNARRYVHTDAERYGFKFGMAKVTRMAHVEGKYHVVAIDTPHRHVQVGVSPTGRSVRIWIDGTEVARPATTADAVSVTDLSEGS